MKKIVCALLVCACVNTIDSTTLVYNMKIRRAFAAGSLLSINKKRHFAWLLTALPIYYQRTRNLSVQQLPNTVHENTRSGGSIFNVRMLAPYHWWAELTTGLEKQTAQYGAPSNTKVSRTGLDDIVASIGKNFFFAQDNGQVVVYGIAGFPNPSRCIIA